MVRDKAAKRREEAGAGPKVDGPLGDKEGELQAEPPVEPVLSKEDRAAAARERYLARKRKAVGDAC